jgi:hypothetical protein
MTGHFVTACGCECYKPIDFPALPEYKLPTKPVTKIEASYGGTGWVKEYGLRKFKLVSVDMKHALAEYEEVQ